MSVKSKKALKTCVLALFMLFAVLANTAVLAVDGNGDSDQGGTTPAANSPEVVAYALSPVDGVQINSLSPGKVFTMAVSVKDPQVAAKALVEAGEGLNIKARLNTGSFSMGDVTNVGYHVLNPAEGLFTIVFSHVTYNGGSPEFRFDLSYFQKSGASEVPFGTLKNISVYVGQAADTSVKPEVVLSNSNFGGKVTAGQAFNLQLTGLNTSPNLTLENMIVKVKLPESMSIGSGSNSVLAGNISPNTSFNSSFQLQVKGGAETGTATVTVEFIYNANVQGRLEQYTSTQEVAIPIVQRERFELYELEAPEFVSLGEEVYLTLGFANKGKGIVYNVSASIEGENIENTAQKQFIGNIAAGTENSVDFYVRAKEMGTMTGNVVLTYEDADGNETVVKTPFSITVEEGFEPMEPGFPMEPELPAETGGKGWLLWVLAVGVLAASAGGFVFYKKKKAKKEAEEADEDF